MAVKFKRDEDRKFDWNVRGRSTEAVRKKTLYIYGGLVIAFFASMVVHMVGKGAGDGMLSSSEGVAVVVEKVFETKGLPEPRYLLRCEVQVSVEGKKGDSDGKPTLKTMSDLVVTDVDSFELVQVGSQITVTYRLSRNHSEIRIHRMILDRPTLPVEA